MAERTVDERLLALEMRVRMIERHLADIRDAVNELAAQIFPTQAKPLPEPEQDDGA